MSLGALFQENFCGPNAVVMIAMITSKLRTVMFVVASIVIGWGLYLILTSIIDAPSDAQNPNIFLQTMVQRAGKGLGWELVGAFAILLVVLWNASALNKDWLHVLGYGFKAFGALTLILLLAFCLRHYQLHRIAEVKRHEAQINVLNDEKKEAIAREKRNQVHAFLTNLAEWSDRPTARSNAIAVAGSQLHSDVGISLETVDALYSVYLHDIDPGVRGAARQALFPDGPEVIPPAEDFAHVVAKLLQQDDSLLKQPQYQRYVAVIKDNYDANDPVLIALTEMEKARTAKIVENNAALQKVQETLAQGTATAATAQEQTAVRDVVIAATSSEQATQDKAVKVLEKSNATQLQATLQNVPPEIRQTLPPRIYLNVPDADASSEKLKTLRQNMQRDESLWLGGKKVIVPNVKKAGKSAPTSTEVRYFAGEDSRDSAARIAKFLTDHGVDDVRITQEVPTPEDLKRDVRGHFEVWFAKKAVTR